MIWDYILSSKIIFFKFNINIINVVAFDEITFDTFALCKLKTPKQFAIFLSFSIAVFSVVVEVLIQLIVVD